MSCVESVVEDLKNCALSSSETGAFESFVPEKATTGQSLFVLFATGVCASVFRVHSSVKVASFA